MTYTETRHVSSNTQRLFETEETRILGRIMGNILRDLKEVYVEKRNKWLL